MILTNLNPHQIRLLTMALQETYQESLSSFQRGNQIEKVKFSFFSYTFSVIYFFINSPVFDERDDMMDIVLLDYPV